MIECNNNDSNLGGQKIKVKARVHSEPKSYYIPQHNQSNRSSILKHFDKNPKKNRAQSLETNRINTSVEFRNGGLRLEPILT